MSGKKTRFHEEPTLIYFINLTAYGSFWYTVQDITGQDNSNIVSCLAQLLMDKIKILILFYWIILLNLYSHFIS